MDDLTRQIRDVRRIYDIRDVLGVADRRSDYTKIVCPLPGHLHAHNTPSFVIFVGRDGIQRFHCFGNCGLEGDVIDLIGHINIAGYNDKDPESVRRAIALLDSSAPVVIPPPSQGKKGLSPAKWKEYLPYRDEVQNYAYTRGLSPATLDYFKIGQYKHFMAMPAFEDMLLKAIKLRNTWPKERVTDQDFDSLRFASVKGSVSALFGYADCAWQTDPVFMLKGEIPVMLLWQYGFRACAPTSGEGAYIEQWKLPLSLSQKVVVVGDNDKDPKVRAEMQAKAKYRAELLRGDLRFPPEQYKDIDEFLLADRSALEVIRSWLL